MTWTEAQRRCPEGVVAVCHNAADTVTVAGPAEAVVDFVADLKKEGVFATNVDSSGIAFHSYFMKQATPILKQRLQEVSFAISCLTASFFFFRNRETSARWCPLLVL